MKRRFLLISLLIGLPWNGEISSAADKLRIGYSGATISHAMLRVTEEGKLFERNGINPEAFYLQAPLGQSARIAGESQMGVDSAALRVPARLPELQCAAVSI